MDRGFNLLIVDDDVGQVQLLEVLMKELGLTHQCHHASDGAKALDYLHRRSPYEDAPRPDLVLLDLNMPGMNGHEVVRSIKSDPNLRSIPVIILSSSRDQTDVDASYSEGANAYINKPSDLETNLKTIASIDQFWGRVVRLPE
jgi:CheY-like chemotaxis protein